MPARSLTFLLAATAMCGCRISRDQVNPHVRDIDTSWIEPGKTTRDQIIERIGMPPTARGIGGMTSDSFRWTLLDKRTGTLEIGYIVTPTFEFSRTHYSEDILVKFSGDGVVSLVSRTVSDGNSTRITEWKEAQR